MIEPHIIYWIKALEWIKKFPYADNYDVESWFTEVVKIEFSLLIQHL